MGQIKNIKLHIVTDIKLVSNCHLQQLNSILNQNGWWKEQTHSRRRSTASGFQSNCFEKISSSLLWKCFDGSTATLVVVLASSFDGSNDVCCIVHWWYSRVRILGCIRLSQPQVLAQAQNCTETRECYRS